VQEDPVIDIEGKTFGEAVNWEDLNCTKLGA